MSDISENHQLQLKIANVEEQLEGLLAEEEVLWDEVNVLERELKHLRERMEAAKETSDMPYAAEDAAVAMMESAARKKAH